MNESNESLLETVVSQSVPVEIDDNIETPLVSKDSFSPIRTNRKVESISSSDDDVIQISRDAPLPSRRDKCTIDLTALDALDVLAEFASCEGY